MLNKTSCPDLIQFHPFECYFGISHQLKGFGSVAFDNFQCKAARMLVSSAQVETGVMHRPLCTNILQ